MKGVLIAFPGHEKLAKALSLKSRLKLVSFDCHRFPDGEVSVRIVSKIKVKTAYILCSLNHPDEKFLTLFFITRELRERGVERVILIAPYLAYMRQDIRFHAGDALTSATFAALVSEIFDGLITVDPHLHRWDSLDQIYMIPNVVLTAADLVGAWVRKNVSRPLLVGPDAESEQWVKRVAQAAGVPSTVLRKKRRGDRKIELSIDAIDAYRGCHPVLVDDIISTGVTAAQTTKLLAKLGLKKAVVVAIHAVFAPQAVETLKQAGVHRVLSTNSILHATNAIFLQDLLASGINQLSRVFARAGHGKA